RLSTIVENAKVESLISQIFNLDLASRSRMRRRTRPGCESSSWCRRWSYTWRWTRRHARRWTGRRSWSSRRCWSRGWTPLAVKQPVASIHYYLPPISALRSSPSDVGRNTNCSVRTHRSECYQGFPEVVLSYLCRRGIWRYDVREDAVEGGDTSHEWVSGVK